MKYDEEGVISLSDIDDAEIDNMILTEEESRLKRFIWDDQNRDWLKEQKQKRKERKTKQKLEKLKKKTNRIKSKLFSQ